MPHQNGRRRSGPFLLLFRLRWKLVVGVDHAGNFGVGLDADGLEWSVLIFRRIDVHAIAHSQARRLGCAVGVLDDQKARVLQLEVERLRIQPSNHAAITTGLGCR